MICEEKTRAKIVTKNTISQKSDKDKFEKRSANSKKKKKNGKQIAPSVVVKKILNVFQGPISARAEVVVESFWMIK